MFIARLRQRRAQAEDLFDDLSEFVSTLERDVREKQAAFQARVAIRAVSSPGDLDDREIEALQNEERQLTEAFPQFLRVGATAMVQSTLEGQLLEIAESVASIRTAEIGLRELAGSPFERAELYFHRVCKLMPLTEAWSTVGQYQAIRNAFVHNQGLINARLQRAGSTREAAAKLSGIKLEGAQIVLEPSFAEGYIKASKSLCLAIIKAAHPPAP